MALHTSQSRLLHNVGECLRAIPLRNGGFWPEPEKTSVSSGLRQTACDNLRRVLEARCRILDYRLMQLPRFQNL